MAKPPHSVTHSVYDPNTFRTTVIQESPTVETSELPKKFKVRVEMEISTSDEYTPEKMQEFQRSISTEYNGTQYLKSALSWNAGATRLIAT